MSEEKPKEDPKPKEGGDEGEKFVPAEAYQSLQQKAASEAAERQRIAAELEQIKADQKAREEQEMAQKQQFEDLWKKEKEEKDQLRETLEKNDQLYKDSIKKSYLKDALGGKVKDQYLDFADISKIELDQAGRPTEESLRAVADQFREAHSVLIPTNQGKDGSDVPPGSGPGKEAGMNIEEAMNDRYAFHDLMKKMNKQ